LFLKKVSDWLDINIESTNMLLVASLKKLTQNEMKEEQNNLF
jgi:hypothetical protein